MGFGKSVLMIFFLPEEGEVKVNGRNETFLITRVLQVVVTQPWRKKDRTKKVVGFICIAFNWVTRQFCAAPSPIEI